MQAHIDGPEAAVSSRVFQEVMVIASPEKYTLPREPDGVLAVGLPVHIIAPGQELLDDIHFGPVVPGHFADFVDPDALDHFAGLFSVEVLQTVAVPVLPNRLQKSRLTDPLGPVEYGYIVVLAARAHHPGYGRGKALAGHRTGIRCIFGRQVIDEHSIEPFRAIPNQGFQIILDLVVFLLVAHQHDGCQGFIPAGDIVPVLQPPQETGVIGIRPKALIRTGVPGQFPKGHPLITEIVDGDFTFKQRVEPEDPQDVVHCLLRVTGIRVIVQLGFPHPIHIKHGFSWFFSDFQLIIFCFHLIIFVFQISEN